MQIHTDDIRIRDIKPLPTPESVLRECVRTDAAAETVMVGRKAFHDILTRKDDRLAVVIGPCSVHDVDAAMEYAHRLRVMREDLKADLEIMMRIYFAKPRTTIGWKGLISDPDLDGSFNIERGLHIARKLLLDVNEIGLPCASEFLDIVAPQYLADLVAWGAIGARTTESQLHRELASGLSCPVGFKNGTDGKVKIAVDAVKASAHPHHFLAVTKQGRAAIAATTGNRDCHIILRGGSSPNYDAASVAMACSELDASGVSQGLMIDLSHGNSGYIPERQPLVADEVARQMESGETRIIGVMAESHLVSGRQDCTAGTPLFYGQSITDGCIDWDMSVLMLERLASAVRQRRTVAPLRIQQEALALA